MERKTMMGPHDMGGNAAGPVHKDEHEASFFEKRVDAMMRLLSHPSRGIVGTDQNRRAIESLPDYNELSYYERWIKSMKILLVEKGLLSEAEIARRMQEIQQREAPREP